MRCGRPSPSRRQPILADPMRRRSRPPRALQLAVRAGAMATVGAAIALPLVRKRLRIPGSGDPRGGRLRAARGRRPRPAHAQTRRRPLRDADVGLHRRPRDALRRSGAPPPSPLHPLSDRDRLARSASAGCPGRACSTCSRGRRGVGSARPLPHRSPTGSGSSSPTRSSPGSSSATRSASPAPPARWRRSSTPAPSATGRCRPRRPGGPPSRG